MMKLTDESILRLLSQDKAQGIKSLFDLYYSPLVVYAEQFLKDRSQSEDLVQEFFVKLWNQDYLETAEVSNLRSYLYRSIRNSALNFLKKNDLLKDTLDLLHVQMPEHFPTSNDDNKIELLLKEVDKLPDRTKLAIELVMIERKKYQEAADEMSISINTVKHLLKEGIKKLRGSFKDTF